MERLTVEKAQALLKELDPSMPDRFSVLAVAYSERNDAYYVRWFDEKEKEIYDDGVAQAKTSGAKNAYSFKPTCSYSAIWFNEDEEGGIRPVTSVLEPNDVKDLRKGTDSLTLLDGV